MQLKTILNRMQKFKSFVYAKVCRVDEPDGESAIEAELQPRRNSWPRCSVCGREAPGYDTLPERRFEFVPLWGIRVYFRYAPRRVSCPVCGVKVEQMPWASGKRTLTEAYARFLSSWARRLSWKEVAEVFHTSWEQVFRAVERAAVLPGSPISQPWSTGQSDPTAWVTA